VKLFDASSFATSSYDVSPDGQRFLMTKPEARPADAAPATLVVVTNCFDAFRSRQRQSHERLRKAMLTGQPSGACAASQSLAADGGGF
jgi:hypothetical protein